MNLATTIHCYGTSEGVQKAWDTRGRGQGQNAQYKHSITSKMRTITPMSKSEQQSFTKGAIRDLRKAGDQEKQRGEYPGDARRLHTAASHLENGNHAEAWNTLRRGTGGGAAIDYVGHLEHGFRRVTGDTREINRGDY